ncbi:MarR family winged helix-turn-helix transcriptional regulator [Microbacterium sp. P05]|uniref:MarR family winged helix-turn-helix transcriptional regulator n=1 Tax=Microbacterium sp. P05 TaxID=3366948 RepID=UPI0037467693
MASERANTRSRKSPTPDELRAWRSFIETSELVKNQIAVELQGDSDLSMGDYVVMLALFEHPAKCMRSSQLAEHISWERSRLSHHLGRMERRGLVTRETAADDSRGAVIALTEAGGRRFRKASPAHMHSVYDTFVAALSDEQLRAVEDAMRALAEHLADREPQGGELSALPPERGAADLLGALVSSHAAPEESDPARDPVA